MSDTRPSSHDRLTSQYVDARHTADLDPREVGGVRKIKIVRSNRAGIVVAQQPTITTSKLPLATNEAQAVTHRRLRAVVASGDDWLRTAGFSRLKGEGWDVATARDGLECLSYLRAHTPDVAVLDAGLLWGGADGVLAIIASGGVPRVPVVMLGNPPRTSVCVHVVTAVLEKPVDVDALTIAVVSAARRAITSDA